MLYIVAVGWLYVVLMMAITERSFAAGAGTFFFYGVLPLSVLLYLLATPARRRALKAKRPAADTQDAAQAPTADGSAAQPDDRA